MDTKLKSSPKIFWILSCVVIGICACVVPTFYPMWGSRAEEEVEGIYNRYEEIAGTLDPIVDGSYILYNEYKDGIPENEIRDEFYNSNFYLLRKYMDYGMFDENGEMLEGSAKSKEGKLLKEDTNYGVRVEIPFGTDEGGIKVDSGYLERNGQYYLEEHFIDRQEYIEEKLAYGRLENIARPENVTFIYGITEENLQAYLTWKENDYWGTDGKYAYRISSNPTFMGALAAFFGVLFLAALLLPRWRGKDAPYIFKAPLEIVICGWGLAFGFVDGMALLSWKGWGWLSNESAFPAWYAVSFLAWAAYFAVVYWFFVCLREMFVLKGVYFKERCLTVRVIRHFRKENAARTNENGERKSRIRGIWLNVKNWCRKQYDNLLHLDFQDKTNSVILKIVIINFIVVSIFTVFWVFSIWGVAVYSIFLFIFLRKYLRQIQEQYRNILSTTNQLAEGHLDVEITGDAGVFAPVQEELVKIQKGFKRAVEEEVKSERMKTDLITNVSHDLKTPLTAIITYVDLLKNEKDEETRKEYIEVLEKKSARLKVLIEDLFEISKATSKNVTMNFMELDVVGLLKQAGLEYDRNFKEANLEVKWNLPEEKALLVLDGAKTYRIFENLIVNITKYALPHTRVYIEAESREKDVVVRMKNVSATELNFDAEEITGRFVRGDVSRNTEGSGLGLAIAKSFTELQNGTLKITTEADLFRVEITFFRPGGAAQETLNQ